MCSFVFPSLLIKIYIWLSLVVCGTWILCKHWEHVHITSCIRLQRSNVCLICFYVKHKHVRINGCIVKKLHSSFSFKAALLLFLFLYIYATLWALNFDSFSYIGYSPLSLPPFAVSVSSPLLSHRFCCLSFVPCIRLGSGPTCCRLLFIGCNLLFFALAIDYFQMPLHFYGLRVCHISPTFCLMSVALAPELACCHSSLHGRPLRPVGFCTWACLCSFAFEAPHICNPLPSHTSLTAILCISVCSCLGPLTMLLASVWAPLQFKT